MYLRTIHDLLVASKVDGLLASSLLNNGGRSSFESWLQAGSAGVDSADEGALLDLRSLELPQRGAKGSAGVLGGHCDVWDEWRGAMGVAGECLE